MVGRQLAHQYGGAVGGLGGFGCLAQIFVGQCADGLAQFERVHDISLLVQSKIKIALCWCSARHFSLRRCSIVRIGANTILIQREKYCRGIVSSA
ncbi:hypothetical protein D3C72_1897730 [compost metagenome]